MQKVTPFLWFDGDAEEALDFYVSLFKNSKIVNITRSQEGGFGPKGSLFSATLQIDGQEFMVLNAGGRKSQFTEAVSLYVNCADQQEVDELWSKLTDGGEESQCGWLKDKYGLSWQIIPTALGEMLSDKDPAKAGRAVQAMLQMQKIDIKRLKEAFDGVAV
jgi:predicted 3-demethylubiquinone-9 3-methyltransferase (glyoxalase superfamily)